MLTLILLVSIHYYSKWRGCGGCKGGGHFLFLGFYFSGSNTIFLSLYGDWCFSSKYISSSWFIILFLLCALFPPFYFLESEVYCGYTCFIYLSNSFSFITYVILLSATPLSALVPFLLNYWKMADLPCTYILVTNSIIGDILCSFWYEAFFYAFLACSHVRGGFEKHMNFLVAFRHFHLFVVPSSLST